MSRKKLPGVLLNHVVSMQRNSIVIIYAFDSQTDRESALSLTHWALS